MKMTIEMPYVSECTISECTYNVSSSCHARAITIGDAVHPGCDTFLGTSKHTRDKDRLAGVGACKVDGCKFNDDFECVAEAVTIGYADNNINCLTYLAR